MEAGALLGWAKTLAQTLAKATDQLCSSSARPTRVAKPGETRETPGFVTHYQSLSVTLGACGSSDPVTNDSRTFWVTEGICLNKSWFPCITLLEFESVLCLNKAHKRKT